ncbi:MAG: aminotransferase class V-fold PLP-dependent enzyme [Puia sp.]
MEYFNASEYYCVFTQNASGALQIVGECYPFCRGSQFLLTADNHNSVNGIREYCNSKGGETIYSEIDAVSLSINEAELDKRLQASASATERLFAFPAQSNVSGVRHSLEWIKKAQDRGWDVLLDRRGICSYFKVGSVCTSS